MFRKLHKQRTVEVKCLDGKDPSPHAPKYVVVLPEEGEDIDQREMEDAGDVAPPVAGLRLDEGVQFKISCFDIGK